MAIGSTAKQVKRPWRRRYQTHYVRVYIAHLREKLEKDPAKPQFILTEPGVGYRLLAEP